MLIQWLPGSRLNATWEDREELQARFPSGSQGQRGVRVPTGAIEDGGVEEADTVQEEKNGDQSEAGSSNTEARPIRRARPNPKYFGTA